MAPKPYDIREPVLSTEVDQEDDYIGPIRNFARPRFAALAKRAVYRMQRIQASGVFEDEAPELRSFWDEWCWYREGYGSGYALLSGAADDTYEDIISGVISELVPSEAHLLAIAADPFFREPDFDQQERLYEVLSSLVTDAAGRRDLSRFEVW